MSDAVESSRHRHSLDLDLHVPQLSQKEQQLYSSFPHLLVYLQTQIYNEETWPLSKLQSQHYSSISSLGPSDSLITQQGIIPSFPSSYT